MIRAGAIDRLATKRATGILRGVNNHVVKQRRRDVVRARKGREHSTWGEHAQGAQVNFFITTHGAIDGGASAGETWWIEHDQIEMCRRRIEFI